jgi:3-phosphoshikimate 1-carboxyvinyltransferase
VWAIPDAGDVLSGQFTYPERLEIRPFVGKLSATVNVPGSKSVTNRALILSALMARHGPRILTGALRSEDTEVMLACLARLGFEFVPFWNIHQIGVGRNKSRSVIPAANADLFVANSGTTMRFLTAMVSLGTGRYRLDGVPRMRERPIQDLLDTLAGPLGVPAKSEQNNGCPPIEIEGTGRWSAGMIRVRSSVSSQFLSGLLLAAPFAGVEVDIRPDGDLVSEPYVEMTVRMLQSWMCDVTRTADGYHVRPIKSNIGGPHRYTIEPDASAASYFWAAAAILGGRVTVSGLTEHSLQGDVRFVDLLQQMGCRVERCEAGITVHGGALRGIDVDMNAISDTVMTLAAVACFAEGPTRIRNVAHVRRKETDRITALATELRRLGAGVEEFPDGLTITPRPLHGAEVETYNDHRMAMSLALIGLKVPGVVIKNPGCAAKTYPGFWDDLNRLTSTS